MVEHPVVKRRSAALAMQIFDFFIMNFMWLKPPIFNTDLLRLGGLVCKKNVHPRLIFFKVKWHVLKKYFLSESI